MSDNIISYEDLLDMDHDALVKECNALEAARLEYYMRLGHTFDDAIWLADEAAQEDTLCEEY